MVAIEVKGRVISVHNNFCGSVTLYGEGNCMVLPTIYSRSSSWMLFFFSLFLLWKRLATRLSLVNCQNGFWSRTFFSTWKDALSCRKRHQRWRFKKRLGFFWKECLLNSNFVLYYTNCIRFLKGIISVWGIFFFAYLLRPQEGALSKILLMHGSSKHKITQLPLKDLNTV